MLIQKDSPVGIDIVVQKIQKSIHDYLTNRVGWSVDDYVSYPRCYRNPDNESILPEHFENGEYREVLFDDRFHVSSYILTDENIEVNELNFNAVKGSITFQGLLDKLYPDVLHRADEEMNNDVLQAVKSSVETEVANMIVGIYNVYNNVSLRKRLKEEVKFDDMNDFHVLRIDFMFTYSDTCCC